MAGAQAFLEGWQRLLDELGPGDLVLDVSPTDERGELRGTIPLVGSRRLDVYLRLEFLDEPRLVTYGVQLMTTNGDVILRYDNSPYHPALPGAPHHVHVGEEIRPVIPQPSLRAILAAVRAASAG